MPTFQLMPDALGMDLPDGRSLRADRHGRVEVDETTAQMIRGSSAMRRYDALLEIPSGRFYPSPQDPTCACGFNPWRWQKVCPRCGADLSGLYQEET